MRTRKSNSQPSQLTPSATPKRILVPLDFSVCSTQALRHALTFAKLCHAEIVLVHVVEPLHSGSMLESSETRRLHNLALHETEHRLAKVARTSVKPHAPVRYLVRAGKPFVVVTDLARKTASELIVLGTHGHTGFPTVLLGSTAERVTRRAHCPVLMVRAPASR
jgi:universal stress protein A